MLHLISGKKQIGRLISHIFRFGLSRKLAATGGFLRRGDAISLGPIVDGHVGANLEQAGCVAVNAVGITVGVRETAAAIDLGAERILRYFNLLLGLLFI